MHQNKIWDELLENLFSHSLDKQKATKEYEYQKERNLHIDEMLTTNLTRSEKELVEEVLVELGIAADRRAELCYRQGVRDCVWLLKQLCVLS